VVRRATPLDHPWLVEVGALAFGALGNYREILPAWLAQDNVLAWVAEVSGERRGFSVIGFFQEEPGNVADILALAVEPAWQSRGLGRALLRHALAMAEATAQAGRLRELRLCVADDNFIGQRLYRSSGFERAAGDFGAYPGGQRAVRMVHPLSATDAARELRSAGGPSR
jgi:ribosomal protein S18 acetylase RimI-like enzyme